ncbi:Phosphopantothenoylcysteine decarboxylase [Handroanthus impetiginosus]|uniref:phosphopantothenoylcysteine decarboxylase n=1 Tax=Handroanthus impetiginosus TaxID=429701 RepID=A0A2G9HQK9_9LAMI|nr:Phosphopantothenoylcysteine decarboxylase [Handroanthus impetiginosus]
MAIPGPSNAYRELSKAEYVLPRILLAATGTMAAVGFPELRHYFSEWADVNAVATRAALHFIDTASFQTTGEILGDNILHLQLRKWAEVLVITPLSANTLCKIAGGLCDNLLTCLLA